MALQSFVRMFVLYLDAKQVTVSSAKSFALQCKQVDVFMQKTRYFPKHKLMALLRFIWSIFVCRSANKLPFIRQKVLRCSANELPF